MEDVPYARILREGWAFIIGGAIVGAIAGFIVAQVLPATYTAQATSMLQVSSPQTSLVDRGQFALDRVGSYADLIDSPDVVSGVRSELGLTEEQYSDADLRAALSATHTADTTLLVISADAPGADEAADMANAAAASLSQVVGSLEEPPVADGEAIEYSLWFDTVVPASAPASPSSPQTVVITGLGALAGLALGGIVAVARTSRRAPTNGKLRADRRAEETGPQAVQASDGDRRV